MKTIAFHSNQLGIRGTEVALYSYAHYNETILGNKSIIVSNPNSDLSALEKFKHRFEVRLIPFEEYDNKLQVDYCYITKEGSIDGLITKKIPSLIHAVFRFNQVHGHRYAYISDWLCENQGMDIHKHSVPYIVDKLPDSKIDFRKKLGIDKSKTVFGCYGGNNQFNIDFVHKVIIEIATKNPNIVFLFMNIDRFASSNINNIIHIPGTYDLETKSSFIYCCDAMIHAREMGETFGLAIAEFSMKNKPIITYSNSTDKCHISILKEKGIYYSSSEVLYDILTNLNKYIKYDDYHTIYSQYSPEIIMDKFNKVFLN